MDIEKTMRERHELLTALRDSLQEELVACENSFSFRPTPRRIRFSIFPLC